MTHQEVFVTTGRPSRGEFVFTFSLLVVFTRQAVASKVAVSWSHEHALVTCWCVMCVLVFTRTHAHIHSQDATTVTWAVV